MAFYQTSTPQNLIPALGMLLQLGQQKWQRGQEEKMNQSSIDTAALNRQLLKSLIQFAPQKESAGARKEGAEADVAEANAGLIKNRLKLMSSLFGGVDQPTDGVGAAAGQGQPALTGDNSIQPMLAPLVSPQMNLSAPLSPAAPASSPLAPLSPGRKFSYIPGKEPFSIEQQEVHPPITPGEAAVIKGTPSKIGQVIPEHRLPLIKAANEAEAGSLANKKATLEDLYGNPEERKSHSEFVRNAAQLSHRLDEMHDVVSKYGNYEYWNPEGAAKLSSLPLDISDNWTKITNPGGVLREGLVHLGKTEQIPLPEHAWTAPMIRNGTTLAAVDQTKKVLSDYVRQYENLPYTKAPVENLTPEVRGLVGETKASKAYQAAYGEPVPTGLSPGASAKSDTSAAASSIAPAKISSQEDYDKLAPGSAYIDSNGAMATKKGGSIVKTGLLPQVNLPLAGSPADSGSPFQIVTPNSFKRRP